MGSRSQGGERFHDPSIDRDPGVAPGACAASRALTYTLTLPSDGRKYYVAMTATDSQGESALTNELSLTETTPPPLSFNASSCPSCTVLTAATIYFGTTGQPITVSWVPQSVGTTASVYAYPPKAGALPITTVSFAANVSTWVWTPTRAGNYYVHLCAGATCVDSYAGGQVYSLKLAAPSGGGIN